MAPVKDYSALFSVIQAKWYALTVENRMANTIYDGNHQGGVIDCDIWCHPYYAAIAAFPHSVNTMTKILEHDPTYVFALSSKDGHIKKVEWRPRSARETVPAPTAAKPRKCAVQ